MFLKLKFSVKAKNLKSLIQYEASYALAITISIDSKENLHYWQVFQL
jgi:hypothetical protein